MYCDLSLKKKRFIDPRWLFAAGLVVSLLTTLSGVSCFGDNGFKVLCNATYDFWHGIVPYGTELCDVKECDLFLYGPLFNILFSPFLLVPYCIAPYLWNGLNFCLFFLAVFSLPEYFSTEQKCRFLLFMLPITVFVQLTFKFDIVTAYLALFAYSLLENGYYKWGVFFIMISAFSGIYGVFQLATLVLYPKFWKNMGLVISSGIVLAATPFMVFQFSDFTVYYKSWFAIMNKHVPCELFFSIFHLEPLLNAPLSWYSSGRILSFAILFLLIAVFKKRHTQPIFRAGVTGLLMGWIVLFGNISAAHTYMVAFSGFMLWYYSRHDYSFMNKILLWCNFAVISTIPVVIFLSESVRNFLFSKFPFNMWCFAITWLWMFVGLFFKNKKNRPPQNSHHFYS